MGPRIRMSSWVHQWIGGLQELQLVQPLIQPAADYEMSCFPVSTTLPRSSTTI